MTTNQSFSKKDNLIRIAKSINMQYIDKLTVEDITDCLLFSGTCFKCTSCAELVLPSDGKCMNCGTVCDTAPLTEFPSVNINVKAKEGKAPSAPKAAKPVVVVEMTPLNVKGSASQEIFNALSEQYRSLFVKDVSDSRIFNIHNHKTYVKFIDKSIWLAENLNIGVNPTKVQGVWQEYKYTTLDEANQIIAAINSI